MAGAAAVAPLDVCVHSELEVFTPAREAARCVAIKGAHGPHLNLAARNLRMDPRLACIQQAACFQGLSLAESIEVLSASQERRFLRRQILFQQAEPVRHVSLLVSGRVKLTQVTGGGDEVILMLSGPGEIVGGLGLGAQSSNQTTAKALETCHVLFWEMRAFGALTERFPVLQRNTVRILAERLQTVQERFSELATEKVGPRLARTLIRLVAHIGQPEEGGVLIGLSREELAQMTGTTLFTVSRLLCQWEERGMVSARREAVLVCSTPGLAELAEAA
jgi:CRP/FNR family transcriptional regulator, nitrogen oxide reductase regulator